MHLRWSSFSVIVEELLVMEKESRDLCLFFIEYLPISRLYNTHRYPVIKSYSLGHLKVVCKCFKFRLSWHKSRFDWISIEFQFIVTNIFWILDSLSMLIDILWNFKLSSYLLLLLSILLKEFKWNLNILESHCDDMFPNLFLNLIHSQFKCDSWNIFLGIPGNIALNWWVCNWTLGHQLCLKPFSYLIEESFFLFLNYFIVIVFYWLLLIVWEGFCSMIYLIFYIFLTDILTYLPKLFLKFDDCHWLWLFLCWWSMVRNWRKARRHKDRCFLTTISTSYSWFSFLWPLTKLDIIFAW